MRSDQYLIQLRRLLFLSILGVIAAHGRTSLAQTNPTIVGALSGQTNTAGFIESIATVPAPVDVLTWHNDNARTGQNLQETILTPTNVNVTSFGKLFVIHVDGKVDAQPLYVSALPVPAKGTHNVVFIATEHDSVYACDADDGAVLWQVSMLKTGETPSDDRSCSQVTPEIGVTATPVIDLTTGPNGTIYVVAMSKDAAGTYFQRLHALNLTSGAEEFGGPKDVAALYPGTGDNSSGGFVIFDPKQYKDRPGLVLSNGVVYTSWGSHCDIRPYTGWLIGYNKRTLARVSVLDFAPNGHEAGLWSSGAAPAVDGSGNIYALTGNGTFDTTLNGNGFPNMGDFGNCFVKVSTANNLLQVADYWTMFNTINESNADLDLGSGGAILLPNMTDAGGMVRHLTVGAGKDKHIYLADRHNMGKFIPGSTSNANLYQDLSGVLAGSVFSTPAYFKGRLYFGPVDDTIKAIHITKARLDTSVASQTTQTFPYPGTTPSISANRTSNGILWAAENATTAVLHAYDPANLATEFYNSNQATGSRDHFGSGNKFIVPTIANGKVYVGTTRGVGVFGLLQPELLNAVSRKTHGAAGTYMPGQVWTRAPPKRNPSTLITP